MGKKQLTGKTVVHYSGSEAIGCVNMRQLDLLPVFLGGDVLMATDQST